MRDEHWTQNIDLHADITAMRLMGRQKYNLGLARGIVVGVFATLIAVALVNWLEWTLGACG